MLPSWVPDPRNFEESNFGILAPMGIRVCQDRTLLCEARLLGVIRDSNHELILCRDELFCKIYRPHQTLDSSSEIIHLTPLRSIKSKWLIHGRPGGILSCFSETFQQYQTLWLILRPLGFTFQAYTLAGTVVPFPPFSRFVENLWSQNYSQYPKINVRIV